MFEDGFLVGHESKMIGSYLRDRRGHRRLLAGPLVQDCCELLTARRGASPPSPSTIQPSEVGFVSWTKNVIRRLIACSITLVPTRLASRSRSANREPFDRFPSHRVERLEHPRRRDGSPQAGVELGSRRDRDPGGAVYNVAPLHRGLGAACWWHRAGDSDPCEEDTAEMPPRVGGRLSSDLISGHGAGHGRGIQRHQDHRVASTGVC